MAASAPSLEQVLAKIQAEVFPKRIRCLEFFKDYDNLRRHMITTPQFVRCLDLLLATARPMYRLTAAEQEVLVEAYKCENGFVQYKSFCDAIETVFTTPGLEVSPRAQPTAAGTTILPAAAIDITSVEQLPDPTPEVSALLHRVALLAETRGVVLKYCFEDADRGDSTSLIVPRRAGSVRFSVLSKKVPSRIINGA